jgi:hypothetical protein
MKSSLVLAPLCLLFTACTPEAPEITIHSSEVASVAPAPRPESSGQDSLIWSFDYQGRDNSPRLSYSGRETDETAVIFECRTPAKVTVALDRIILGRKPSDWPFTLTSDNVEARFRGRLVRIELDHFLIEAQTALSAPIFTAIRDSGKASLDDSSRLTPMPMNAIDDSERQAIADFLLACEPA